MSKIFCALEKLIEDINSAFIVVLSNPWVGPLLRTKISFFVLYMLWWTIV